MGLSDNGSYALIFCVTFLLIVCLTVVTAKIFDRTPPLPAGKYAPPFPDTAPLLPKPTAAPNQAGGCVSYCTNSATGDMEPCEAVALQTCTSDSDCANCMAATPRQDIKCAAPTQWPHVQAQQASLNNKSDKYCLPTRASCLNLPDTAPLQECNSDADCLRCNDALPNGEKFQCQPTKQNTFVNLAGKTVLAPYTGSFCVPQYTGCDPQYGVATWTSDRQWKCDCKYPNVMGGPACDQLVACNASELTPWSKDKQQLLLNIPGEDGSKVGDPWTIASGVDPNKCVGADGKQVECSAAASTRTVACRCDGVHAGSLATYTFTPGDPLTCTLDPCYASDFGTGKTWLYDATRGTDKTQLPTIPNLPVAAGPQCSCSGFGSGVWTYQAPKDNTDPTQGYKWKGYCKEVHVPGTSIVLPADADQAVCAAQKQANTDAQASLLIPGVNQQGKAVCAVDPCSGLSSDKSYRTNIGVTGSFGHFDAKAGTCLCSTMDGAVNIELTATNCDRTVNPACSYCANACIGGQQEIETLCPVQKGSSCSPVCTTSPTGAKVCECGKVPGGNQCFWYNGECVEQKNFMECCEDFHGVAGVCAGKENSCRVVRSKSTGNGCSVATQDFVQQAVVCDHRDQCGSGWCGAAGKGPTCKCGDAAGCTTAHFKGTCGVKNPRNK